LEGGGRKMARKAQPNCTLRCIYFVGDPIVAVFRAKRRVVPIHAWVNKEQGSGWEGY
jgi:hypothetical protein